MWGAVRVSGIDTSARTATCTTTTSCATATPPVPARVEVLAGGLGEPVERIRAWGFVAAVVSEVWDADDGPVPTGRALQIAQLPAP